ncbi:MAG: hypothetical protein ACYC4L_17580 [Chloroflexota bacterium]
MRKDPRGLVTFAVGLITILLGLLFLVQQTLELRLWDISWPLIVVVPGLLLFVAMALGGTRAAPLAVPAAVVTVTGLVLLYQNLSGHWGSWVYAWALVWPTAAGLGRVVQGVWSEERADVRQGLGWARLGLVLFAVGGIFFEMVLGLGGDPWGRFLWPSLLIGLGAYLLLRRGAPAVDRPTERLPIIVPPAPAPQAAPPGAPLVGADEDDDEDDEDDL